jgi:hypothetical protein
MWGNNSTPGYVSFDVFSPNVGSSLIYIQSRSTEGSGSANTAFNNYYCSNIAGSYVADGFTLLAASGNITGTVRVYGYAV